MEKNDWLEALLYKVRKTGWILAAVLLVTGCSGEPEKHDDQTELLVSAAASLTDALQEVKASFEADHPKIKITYQFGSSGKLAQQIQQGAPVDVFLSASRQDMEQLQKGRTIYPDTLANVASNEIVLIGQDESPTTISGFEDIRPEHIRHFAVGEPETVPAGRYAKEVLESLGLWNRLQGKLVLAKDVRQVLTYVESGNADLGMAYYTDALASDHVRILARAKPEWHEPIVYPVAVVSASEHPEEAKLFISYLTGPKGKQILKKYGFQ